MLKMVYHPYKQLKALSQKCTQCFQRMNELATQAANGTNSTTDRSAIQDEISQLTTEIDRVS